MEQRPLHPSKSPRGQGESRIGHYGYAPGPKGACILYAPLLKRETLFSLNATLEAWVAGHAHRLAPCPKGKSNHALQFA
jgi:hypothetical protein